MRRFDTKGVDKQLSPAVLRVEVLNRAAPRSRNLCGSCQQLARRVGAKPRRVRRSEHTRVVCALPLLCDQTRAENANQNVSVAATSRNRRRIDEQSTTNLARAEHFVARPADVAGMQADIGAGAASSRHVHLPVVHLPQPDHAQLLRDVQHEAARPVPRQSGRRFGLICFATTERRFSQRRVRTRQLRWRRQSRNRRQHYRRSLACIPTNRDSCSHSKRNQVCPMLSRVALTCAPCAALPDLDIRAALKVWPPCSLL